MGGRLVSTAGIMSPEVGGRVDSPKEKVEVGRGRGMGGRLVSPTRIMSQEVEG